MARVAFFRKKKKRKKRGISRAPLCRIEKVVVVHRIGGKMLLTISTGRNKVGNFIRFSSVPASMVKIKEGRIEERGVARVR